MIPSSKRIWSFPFPVAPWQMAVAPSLRADFHQLLGDQGLAMEVPSRYLFHNRMCFYAGHNVFITEFVDNIQNVKLGSAAEFCSFFKTVQLFRLSAVDADADDFIVKVFLSATG